jgi:hypothetical protein
MIADRRTLGRLAGSDQVGADGADGRRQQLRQHAIDW